MMTLLDRQYGKGKVVLEEAREASEAGRALARYFKGDLGAIEKLEVANGGTAFQRKVWKALRAIPAGRTTSYGALAKALGLPQAARAVGLANGANPIAIVVPCHRVIGADGSLTGYGGGMRRKEWLLAHERRG
jgi:methylated-DNA-[protein]-cysteine S-methyltransferase